MSEIRSRSLPPFVLLALCVAACTKSDDTGEGTRNGNRVVVLGMDGATWDVIDPMIANGELPNFKKLIAKGARANFITYPPSRSPTIWTTMATGRYPSDHNILHFTYPYDADRKEKTLVQSTLRRVPAIWNLASAGGRTVDAVSYFVSHPAEVISGVMVSDQAPHESASVHPPRAMDDEDDVTALHAIMGSGERTAEEERLREELLGRFVKFEYDPAVLKQPDHPLYEATHVVAERVDHQVLKDEYTRRVSRALLAKKSDLLISYYRIVDHVCHASWKYFDDTNFEEKPSAENKQLLGGLVPEAYRYMDECLGDVMDAVGDEANIVIVSDHGFGSATGQYGIQVSKEGREWLSGNHRRSGIFLAAGPDFKHGPCDGMSIMDVTPTLLALLDLPVSEEIDGRIPRPIFRDGFFDDHPVQTVTSYRDVKRAFAQGDGTGGNQSNEADMLKALGYLEGGTNVTGDLTLLKIKSDVWNCDTELRHQVLVGEFMDYASTGAVGKMRALALKVKARKPEEYRRIIKRVSVEVGRTLQVYLRYEPKVKRGGYGSPTAEVRRTAESLVEAYVSGNFIKIHQIAAEVREQQSEDIPEILDNVVTALRKVLDETLEMNKAAGAGG